MLLCKSRFRKSNQDTQFFSIHTYINLVSGIFHGIEPHGWWFVLFGLKFNGSEWKVVTNENWHHSRHFHAMTHIYAQRPQIIYWEYRDIIHWPADNRTKQNRKERKWEWRENNGVHNDSTRTRENTHSYCKWPVQVFIRIETLTDEVGNNKNKRCPFFERKKETIQLRFNGIHCRQLVLLSRLIFNIHPLSFTLAFDYNKFCLTVQKARLRRRFPPFMLVFYVDFNKWHLFGCTKLSDNH